MKPTPEQVAAIPPEMRERPQWLRRRGKVPWHATEDRPGSSTDPATWGTLDAALTRVGQHGTDGIGFAFAPDDGLLGVDLDHAITDAGTLEPWAAEIVAGFKSYSELSLSGTGVHVIARGELPGGRGRKRDGVELYDRGRFFVVTGAVLDGAPREIATANGALTRLLESLGQTSTNTTPATVSTDGKPRHDFLLGKACDLARVPLHADAIVAALRVLRDQITTPGARPITDAELAGIVRWAVEHTNEGTTPAALFAPRLLDVQRILAEPLPPIPYRIDGLLAEPDNVLIGGPWGVGKSPLAWSLALSLSFGKNFLGKHEVLPASRPERWLFLDDENSQHLTSVRLKLYCNGLGLRADAVADRIKVCCRQRWGDLTDPMRWAALAEIVRAEQVSGVVLDSLVRFLGARNENAAAEMSAWYQQVILRGNEELGVQFVALHHWNKPGIGQARWDLGSRFRGSGDIPAQFDQVLAYEANNEDKIRTLHHVRSRWDTELPDVCVKLEGGPAEGFSRLVVVEGSAQAETIVMQMLLDAQRTGVPRAELVAALRHTGMTDDAAGKAVSRLLNGWRGKGRIGERKDGKTLRVWAREFAPKDALDNAA